MPSPNVAGWLGIWSRRRPAFLIKQICPERSKFSRRGCDLPIWSVYPYMCVLRVRYEWCITDTRCSEYSHTRSVKSSPMFAPSPGVTSWDILDRVYSRMVCPSDCLVFWRVPSWIHITESSPGNTPEMCSRSGTPFAMTPCVLQTDTICDTSALQNTMSPLSSWNGTSMSYNGTSIIAKCIRCGIYGISARWRWLRVKCFADFCRYGDFCGDDEVMNERIEAYNLRVHVTARGHIDMLSLSTSWRYSCKQFMWC